MIKMLAKFYDVVLYLDEESESDTTSFKSGLVMTTWRHCWTQGRWTGKFVLDLERATFPDSATAGWGKMGMVESVQFLATICDGTDIVNSRTFQNTDATLY